MKRLTAELGSKLEFSIITITALAKILINNGLFNDGSQGEPESQLDNDDERGIQSAIQILSDQAQLDLIGLMNSLEVRQVAK